MEQVNNCFLNKDWNSSFPSLTLIRQTVPRDETPTSKSIWPEVDDCWQFSNLASISYFG